MELLYDERAKTSTHCRRWGWTNLKYRGVRISAKTLRAANCGRRVGKEAGGRVRLDHVHGIAARRKGKVNDHEG